MTRVVGTLLLLCATAHAWAPTPAPAAGGSDAASALQEKLSGMIAAGQQKLQVVEQKNADLMKATRADAGALLKKQAQDLGAAFSSYTGNLTTAEVELKNAVDSAQSASDELKKQPVDDSKKLENVEQMASLNAKLQTAKRQLKRAQSKRKQVLRSAGEDAETQIDDESMRLGAKLGDLSKETDPAKADVQAVIDQGVSADAPPTTPSPEAVAQFAEDDDAGLLSVLNKDGYDVTTKAPAAKAAKAAPAPVTTTTAKPPAAKPVEKKKAGLVSIAQVTKDLTAAVAAEAATAKKEQARLRATVQAANKDAKKAFDKLEKDLVVKRKALVAAVAR